jgi:hypothetical protein
MKLSKHYKSSEYIFLFSILVLALLLGTYFSFYAFLWRDIKSDVTGFSKYQMEGMTNPCNSGEYYCNNPTGNPNKPMSCQCQTTNCGNGGSCIV